MGDLWVRFHCKIHVTCKIVKYSNKHQTLLESNKVKRQENEDLEIKCFVRFKLSKLLYLNLEGSFLWMPFLPPHCLNEIKIFEI